MKNISVILISIFFVACGGSSANESLISETLDAKVVVNTNTNANTGNSTSIKTNATTSTTITNTDIAVSDTGVINQDTGNYKTNIDTGVNPGTEKDTGTNTGTDTGNVAVDTGTPDSGNISTATATSTATHTIQGVIEGKFVQVIIPDHLYSSNSQSPVCTLISISHEIITDYFGINPCSNVQYFCTTDPVGNTPNSIISENIEKSTGIKSCNKKESLTSPNPNAFYLCCV